MSESKAAIAAIAAFYFNFLFKQTLTTSVEGNLIMEKGTQTLLGNYVSIYERPTNAVNIQMRKKQNELESLP